MDNVKIIQWLLRLIGGVMLLAVLAVVMPRQWMEVVHQWLGLGEMPQGPIVDYLARSISALYAIHGGVLIVASSNVRHYRGLIVYLASVACLLGVVLFFIDLEAGMPWLWTLGEGPPVVLMNGLILALIRRVE